MMFSLPFYNFLVQAAVEPGLFSYVGQSNFAGKVILLVLAVFSVMAWSVMLGKYKELSRVRSKNQAYEHYLAQKNHLSEIGLERSNQSDCPFHSIGCEGLQAFSRATHAGLDRKDPSRADVRMGQVENALQRAVARQSMRYEARMALLGSIVSGAPFLGLLGTVWGVMDAFGSLPGAGLASLQGLAPGVSGALLTTVASLLVAIPSVFGYNYLLQQIRIAVVELENFASTVADRIELEAESDTSGHSDF